MTTARFSEAQIIGILKEHQAGMSAPDLCRNHGLRDVVEQTHRRVRQARTMCAVQGHYARSGAQRVQQGTFSCS